MPPKLTANQAKQRIEEVLDSFPHKFCATCECFLGYLTRLELDTDEHLEALFSPYKPEKSLIHHCMGCDPCPPADAFARYQQTRILIDPKSILG